MCYTTKTLSFPKPLKEQSVSSKNQLPVLKGIVAWVPNMFLERDTEKICQICYINIHMTGGLKLSFLISKILWTFNSAFERIMEAKNHLLSSYFLWRRTFIVCCALWKSVHKSFLLFGRFLQFGFKSFSYHDFWKPSVASGSFKTVVYDKSTILRMSLSIYEKSRYQKFHSVTVPLRKYNSISYKLKWRHFPFLLEH